MATFAHIPVYVVVKLDEEVKTVEDADAVINGAFNRLAEYMEKYPELDHVELGISPDSFFVSDYSFEDHPA